MSDKAPPEQPVLWWHFHLTHSQDSCNEKPSKSNLLKQKRISIWHCLYWYGNMCPQKKNPFAWSVNWYNDDAIDCFALPMQKINYADEYGLRWHFWKRGNFQFYHQFCFKICWKLSSSHSQCHIERKGWCQNVSSNKTLCIYLLQSENEKVKLNWTLLSPCKVALVPTFLNILTVIYDLTPLALVSCQYFIWHFLDASWLACVDVSCPSPLRITQWCAFCCVLKIWSCQEELCVGVIPNIVSDSFSTFNHVFFWWSNLKKLSDACCLD